MKKPSRSLLALVRYELKEVERALRRLTKKRDELQKELERMSPKSKSLKKRRGKPRFSNLS